MYNFEYVSKEDYMPEREELITIISDVQKEVREHFTFTYKFIGSSSRNMITCDYSTNIGYDFDVDIDLNIDEENYTAKEIKTILMDAFNKVNKTTKYGNCKDSTRVFTIKVVNTNESRIMHSCDFAVINDCSDGRRQYIHHNKPHESYYWEYKPHGYYELPVKVKWCKDNNLWTEVRSNYLDKKNNNRDINKHSSAMYAETVNEVYNKYHD